MACVRLEGPRPLHVHLHPSPHTHKPAHLCAQTTVDLLERAAEYASRAPPSAPGPVLAALDAAIGASPSSPSHQHVRAQLREHMRALSAPPVAAGARTSDPGATKAQGGASADTLLPSPTKGALSPTYAGARGTWRGCMVCVRMWVGG